MAGFLNVKLYVYFINSRKLNNYNSEIQKSITVSHYTVQLKYRMMKQWMERLTKIYCSLQC